MKPIRTRFIASAFASLALFASSVALAHSPAGTASTIAMAERVASAQAGGLVPEGGGTAALQVVHLAPFASGAGTSVTVALNGVPALNGVLYGGSTAYLNLAPGEYDIDIIPTGATDPAISATATLVADASYTAIAVGNGTEQPLGLVLLEDDLTAPAAGNFHLRLGHLAPFASGPAVLADVRLQDNTPILQGVTFGDVSGFIPLPAGTYDLVITTPGGGTVLIDPLPVTLAAGQILSAFAAGDGENQPLGVFALPAGTPGSFLPLGAPPPPPPAPAQPVPGPTTWGLLALVLVLVAASAGVLRRRSRG